MLRRTVHSLCAVLLATMTVADEAEPESIRRIAVPSFRYAGRRKGYERRFAERLARAFERDRPILAPLAPDDVEAGLAAWREALPDDERETRAAALDRALAGHLDSDAATTIREALDADTLVLGGITADTRAVVVELWDLRKPVCLGRWLAEGDNLGELLPKSDTLAAAVLHAWPIEAPLLVLDDRSDPPRRVVDGRFAIPLGRKQRIRRDTVVWLLASPERDGDGAYVGILAIGRILEARGDRSDGVIEAVRTGADPSTAVLAVIPPPEPAPTGLIEARPFIYYEFGRDD